MHFNPVLAFAAIATTVSALPTTLSTRDAGPSGSVISPAGDTHYAPGSAIHFQYQAVSTDVAQTTSVAVQFITFDGRVTRNDNNFTMAALLTFPDGGDVIDTWLRIPPLFSADGSTAWVANLQVTETQTGSLGAAPFLSAAPRITIY